MCCLHIHRYRTINWSIPAATPLKKGKPAFPPLHSKGSGLQNLSLIPDGRWNSCIPCRSHNFSEGFVINSLMPRRHCCTLLWPLKSCFLLFYVCAYMYICVCLSVMHVYVCGGQRTTVGCHSSGSIIRPELTRLGWSESHRN